MPSPNRPRPSRHAQFYSATAAKQRKRWWVCLIHSYARWPASKLRRASTWVGQKRARRCKNHQALRSFAARLGNLPLIRDRGHQRRSSHHFAKTMEDLQIAAAIINLFFSRLQELDDDERLATHMLETVNSTNYLYECLKAESLQKLFRQRNKPFSMITRLGSFPAFASTEQLKKISLGIYQVRQAKSYCRVHLDNNDGQFVAHILDDDICEQYFKRFYTDENAPCLVLANIKSRFVSTRHSYSLTKWRMKTQEFWPITASAKMVAEPLDAART